MNKQALMLLAAVLMFAPQFALAEAGCPPGMVPYRAGTDPNACGPMPQGPAPITPTGPGWSSRWGAIAQDMASGVVGAVANRESKRQAKKDALAECKSRGGSDCRSELEYTNQCAAIVQGSTASNFSHAATVEQAIDLGTNACKKRGDSDCHIYYQACSMPVRVR
jgi:hypothetical protein